MAWWHGGSGGTCPWLTFLSAVERAPEEGGGRERLPTNLRGAHASHCTMSASFSWFPFIRNRDAVLNIVQAQVSSFESAH